MFVCATAALFVGHSAEGVYQQSPKARGHLRIDTSCPHDDSAVFSVDPVSRMIDGGRQDCPGLIVLLMFPPTPTISDFLFFFPPLPLPPLALESREISLHGFVST